MFGSEILETAIGLIFVYTLLSLACSVLTESVARLFNMRGATLKRAIRQLIYGDFSPVIADLHTYRTLNQPNDLSSAASGQSDGNGKNKKTVEDFYNHGLIKPLQKTAFFFWKNSPSYIAPRTFAMTLVDMLLSYQQQSAPGVKATSKGTEAAPTQELEFVKRVVDLLPTDFAPIKSGFLHLLEKRDLPASERLEFDSQNSFKELEDAVNHLKSLNPQLHQVMMPILRAGKANASNWQQAYDRTLREIEGWYSDSMDRVSGWYGRSARTVTFLIALAVTLIFNIDTLAMGSALYTNASLRDVVVSAASNYVAQPEATSSETTSSENTSTDDASSTASAEETQLNSDENSTTAPSLPKLQAQLIALGLPMGWHIADDYQCTWWDALLCKAEFQAVTANVNTIDESQNYPVQSGRIAGKLAGLALTLIALTLGAPFWFDLLKQLINMRSSGKVPSTESSASKPT